jgi:hypothetical protein
LQRTLTLAAFVLALVSAPPAQAVIGTADKVPAVTLLFPYLEVDVGLPAGTDVTTLIAIQNISATAILLHLTLWTDLGIPTLGFDAYLTGFDLQTINLHKVLVDGDRKVDLDGGCRSGGGIQAWAIAPAGN